MKTGRNSVGSLVLVICATLALLGCGEREQPTAPQPAEPPSREGTQAGPSRDPAKPFPAWKLPDSAGAPEAAELPEAVAELHELDPGGSRCAEKLRTVLPVLRSGSGERSLWRARDLAGLSERVTVTAGRHAGQPALPLHTAAGGGRDGALTLWPCRGEPLRWSMGELAARPDRYLLVKSGKDTFKLIDADTPDARPVAKNLAALSVETGAPPKPSTTPP